MVFDHGHHDLGRIHNHHWIDDGHGRTKEIEDHGLRNSGGQVPEGDPAGKQGVPEVLKVDSAEGGKVDMLEVVQYRERVGR